MSTPSSFGLVVVEGPWSLMVWTQVCTASCGIDAVAIWEATFDDALSLLIVEHTGRILPSIETYMKRLAYRSCEGSLTGSGSTRID